MPPWTISGLIHMFILAVPTSTVSNSGRPGVWTTMWWTSARASMNAMNFTFAEILQRASLGVELAPGEVIGSGTCDGGCLLELIGSGVMPERWLQPGDMVTLAVDGLGELESRVVLA